MLGCPYEGDIAPQAVADVSLRLLEMGCTEISLGDTIGVGTPAGVRRLLDALLPQIPASQLAGHFHDTYGMAIANIVAAMECGLATFDSSVAGLGGCPYAKGATGNVAVNINVSAAATKAEVDVANIPTGSGTGVAASTTIRPAPIAWMSTIGSAMQ